MKITVLAENTSRSPQFGAEHGLSLYIETDRHYVLFDMGQSDLFSKNAAQLGVDLTKVDFAVLSHGHYDHGGGIGTFLKINDSAPIYISRFAFGGYYNGKSKYIGLDPNFSGHPRLISVEDSYRICHGITLFSGNREIDKAKIDPFGLTEFDGTDYLPDSFSHEQYLLIEENGKRVLFTGCAHKGILNLVEWIRPDVVIGGFHFKSIALDEKGIGRLWDAAEILAGYDTEYYTCHCTGVEQYRYLKDRMERLHDLAVGDTITV